MKKKCSVIILPTEKAVEDGQLFLDEGIVKIYSGDRNRVFTGQHLYITSDDEIKEGDWFIGGSDGELKQYTQGYTDVESKKVIASTDPELTLKSVPSEEFRNVREVVDNLPQIPESFIEEYVKNPVDEVMVEVTGERKVFMENANMGIFDGSPREFIDKKTIKYVLDNNQIITSSVEEKMYIRNEVEIKLLQMLSSVKIHCLDKPIKDFDGLKWIGEYL